ncbi:SDR family oxidoreductase [Microbulbifer guangxiensis]|uniref:SDR family oxidoreductase n=1 Tax=Microbulbifer guangxiensis TaxID=2904249 RepID=UPI001F3B68FC|nr:SDR family oxidoreductase [Microbulbifer guangxiensis]
MDEKVALVTNALDFVGPPAVQVLLEDSYRVIAQDPTFSDLGQLQAYSRQCPGTDPVAITEPEEFMEYVWGTYGKLDVLISNDTFPAIHTPVEDASIDDLYATIENVMVAPFRLMQAAVPRLKAQGSGNVILVTSCRTELPLPGGAIPDMARAGANALVKSLSIELAPLGIPVNAIAPNYLYSEAYFPKAKFIDDPVGSAFIREVVPAGRLGEPQEVGELVRYLANMKGSFHTGTIIKFAGGWPAAPLRPL